MRTAEELLATVQGSPDAVAAGDRNAWVDLYSAEGIVNDPVGSKPHVGKAAIARFYDTFIAPNTINFHVENDIVSGMSIVRDLTLETIMSTGATLNVPMHLRYDLVDENGVLKIARLEAHWELAKMIRGLLGAGMAGLTASAKLTPQLIGNQGFGGALGFMRGLKGVGEEGKRAAQSALDGDGTLEVELASGEPISRESLSGSYRKFIAAGRTVSATVERSTGNGVVFVRFAPSGLDIESVTLFPG
ncbi:nuclear transport factor 2 family protein [Rhodococcus sp. G-MC3]|uniref:nuclear transport factor 2 family protein n=1 Tax=Rhodococcus sp. G-MC3 TaxID=3046209 RepID=UPI0030143AAC